MASKAGVATPALFAASRSVYFDVAAGIEVAGRVVSGVVQVLDVHPMRGGIGRSITPTDGSVGVVRVAVLPSSHPCTATGVRRARTNCAARHHLAGGSWHALVQVISIWIQRAIGALRERRGCQSDRHQGCGNECFVVHGICSMVKRVPARLGFVVDLLSRRDKPRSRLGLMRFSKQLIDALGVTARAQKTDPLSTISSEEKTHVGDGWQKIPSATIDG